MLWDPLVQTRYSIVLIVTTKGNSRRRGQHHRHCETPILSGSTSAPPYQPNHLNLHSNCIKSRSSIVQDLGYLENRSWPVQFLSYCSTDLHLESQGILSRGQTQPILVTDLLLSSPVGTVGKKMFNLFCDTDSLFMEKAGFMRRSL